MEGNMENNVQKTDTESKQIQDKVSIDMQILKHKEELLALCYNSNDQNTIIDTIRQWPTPAIRQAALATTKLTKTNNAYYVGDLCNQMFHGYGLLIYEEVQAGRFYEGDFQNNCKHGNGFQYIRGDIYVGKFVNNKPQDQNAIFLWKNKDLYMGAFINGMKHGLGRWESGQDYYEGIWKLNRPQGKGKIHTKISDYQGEIKNGYKHGRGVQIFTNGDRYEGLYANGKPEGDGVYQWKNGAIYKGQFKNGIRYGYGEWQFGNQKYEGDYVNDKRNGQGVYKWGNNSYYKGEFVDDMRHGIGEMHWEDAFYKGQWVEGSQSGFGQLWEGGRLVNKGIFQDGKFVKEPQKFQKSRHSLQQHDNKKNRYAGLDRRDRTRNSSYNTNNSNLIQIDQLPKPIKSKRQNIVSTSFSHPRKTNHLPQVSHEPTRHERKTNIEKPNQKNYLPTPIKKQQIPRAASMQKNNKIFKKRVTAISKTASKSIGVDLEMTETQLGPIKWRNFNNMKNQGDSTNGTYV